MPFTLAIVAVVFSWTWYLEQRAPASAVVVAGVIVIALAAWHDAKHRAWGLDWRAVWPGLVRVLIVTLPAVGVMLAAGAALGTLHDRRDLLGSLGPLAVWGLAQQWVLQTVVLAEAQLLDVAALGHLDRGRDLRGHPSAESVSRRCDVRWCAALVRHLQPAPEHPAARLFAWARHAGHPPRVQP